MKNVLRPRSRSLPLAGLILSLLAGASSAQAVAASASPRAAATIGTASPAAARADGSQLDGNDLKIEIGVPEFSMPSSFGSDLCRVRLENGGKSDRRLTLRMVNAFRHDVLRETVVVRAGTTRNVDLPIAIAQYWSSIVVDDEGGGTIVSKQLSRSPVMGAYRVGAVPTAVPTAAVTGLGVVGALYVAATGPDESLAAGIRLHGGALQLVHLVPADVPLRWQAMSAADLVVLEDGTTPELSIASKEALRDYVLCGGTLVVVRTDPAAVRAWIPEARADEDDGSRVSLARALFGMVVFCDPGAAPDQQLWTEVLDAVKGPPGNESLARLSNDARVAAPTAAGEALPGVTEVSPSALALVLVLYSVLAGPATLWWLARRGRRLLVLVTVPALALVFLVVIVGYGLIHEGFRTRLVARSVTWIDADTRTAVRQGLDGFHGGAFLSPALSYSARTLVVPLHTDPRVEQGIDWSEGVELFGQWVRPRVSDDLVVIAPRPCRARVLLHDGEDAPRIENGLGVPVRSLLARTRDGATLIVRDLGTGETAAAAPAAGRAFRDLYGEIDPELQRSWTMPPLVESLRLEPGEWIAVLERELEDDLGAAGLEVLEGIAIARGTLE